MSDFSRRLPVYLLVDTSGSMTGEPIEAVKQGIKALVMELKTDPQALETAYLSVISFASTAVQLSPLTEIISFKEPHLQAHGVTAFGSALNLLMDCINSEVRKSDASHKGDWKPLVFIITDGTPTDDWEQQADLLKNSGVANIIACAAGSNADTKVLKAVTDNVLMMNTLSAGDFSKFFRWVSSSVKMTSVSVDARPGGAVQLPPAPDGFVIVP